MSDRESHVPTELTDAWATQSTAPASPPLLDRARLSEGSRGPRRESVRSHVFTIVILAVTLAVLTWYFFGYLGLSSATIDGVVGFGVGAMLGVLAVRVLVEIVSLTLLLRVDFAEATREFARASHRFLSYRAKVNERFVRVALLVYSVGYFALVYRFKEAFGTVVLVLLIVSYPAIMAGVYFLAIRPGLRREREVLAEYAELLDGLESGKAGAT